MEEKTFVGFNFGRFQNDAGQWQEYCNAFMLEDLSGSESNDYHFGGQKAVKYGCVNPEIYKDIKPGTRVQCYFDSKRKISFMVPVKQA